MTYISSRKKQLLFVGMVTFLILSFFMFQYGFADTCDNTRKWLGSVYDYFTKGLFDDVYDILLGENSYLTTIANAEMITTARDALKVFACGIVIIIACKQLFSDMTKGGDFLETWFRFFITLSVSIIAVLNISEIFTLLDELGKLICDKLVEGFESSATGESFRSTFIDNILPDDSGMIVSILTKIEVMMPYMIVRISVVAAKIVSYSIFIEMAIREILAPFAIANIASEGFRSPGIAYLKRYLALYLRMGIILCICAVDSIILQGVLVSGGIKIVWETIAVNFACVTMMFQSGDVANQALGV